MTATAGSKKYDWSTKIIIVIEESIHEYLIVKQLLNKTDANSMWIKTKKEALNYCDQFKQVDLIIIVKTFMTVDNSDIKRQFLQINPSYKIAEMSIKDFEIKFSELEVINKMTGQIMEFGLFVDKIT
jgi:PleD family two-component response regulator